MDVSLDTLKNMWEKASEKVQMGFMIYIAQDIKKQILVDVQENLKEFMSTDGSFDPDALETLNLLNYASQREKRLISFMVGFMGRPLATLGNKLPFVISVVELIYGICTGCVMPFGFHNQS